MVTLGSRQLVYTQDATDEFEAIHSAKAKSQLQEFIIGKVGDKSSAPANEKMAADTAKVGSSHAHPVIR